MSKLQPLNLEYKWEKIPKKTKFQFFNSSEKRFKDLGLDGKDDKSKPTIRTYLNHISTPEKQ
jgi:hypothetical protein